jgi:hypothetical protein
MLFPTLLLSQLTDDYALAGWIVVGGREGEQQLVVQHSYSSTWVICILYSGGSEMHSLPID